MIYAGLWRAEWARLGKYTGSRAGGQALNRAFELLMEAVPPLDDAEG